MIKIGLDAFGGDYGIEVTVPSAINAVKEVPDMEVVIFGDEKKILPLIDGVGRISVVHTDKMIDMGEKDPIRAMRSQKDTSLVMLMNAAKAGEVDAVVTAGPTQCIVAGAHLILRKLDVVSRLALCPLISNLDGRARVLLDVGANVELRPEHFVELATMGSIISKIVLGVDAPKVGLVNIGSEPGKGREVDKETFKELAKADEINFYGNVEPTLLLNSPVDVMVSDGFSGNLCIKAIEGTAKTMGKMLTEEIKSSIGGKIGYIFMRKNLARFKKRMDTSEIGGAMLVGASVPLVKAHGNSNIKAFTIAIKQARQMVYGGLIDQIKQTLEVKKGDANAATE